jgi:hypothetical protein
MTLLRRAVLSVPLALSGLLLSSAAYAQINISNCPSGIKCGNISGGGSIAGLIVNIINFILAFLGVLAILFIVVAGIRLVVSQGDDSAKDKAKKTIIYAVVGLIVVILAGTIVNLANVAANWIN